MKANILTRLNMRKLKAGQKIIEKGITFERLKNGDGKFTVNIMVDGNRIHRVVGNQSDGTTLTQVQDYIAQIKTDARHGRLNLPKGRKLHIKFEEASDNYIKRLEAEGGKDIAAKTRRLRDHLKPFFKGKALNQISTHDIEKFKKYRQDSKAKNGTINRDLSVISHLINKSLEWGWLEKKPCKINRLKEDPGRTAYLSVEQAHHLLETAKKQQEPMAYLFIKIGLATSMRRMEILSIKISDIHLEKSSIHIPKAKTGSREQPITPELKRFLTEYLNILPKDQIWLFPSKRSESGHMVAIEKSYKKVVREAGFNINEVVRHTLRHTAISHLVQSHIDLPTVKRISGHKTLSMVERYSHQNGSHIQAAMAKLDQKYENHSKSSLITQELHKGQKSKKQESPRTPNIGGGTSENRTPDTRIFSPCAGNYTYSVNFFAPITCSAPKHN